MVSAMPEWWPDWRGQTCVIVAGGPSAGSQDYRLVWSSSARVIAINNAHQLVPWADILFACDRAWWQHYGPELDFAGLRITTDERHDEIDPSLGVERINMLRHREDVVLGKGACVGWGGNSGFQALNLALLLGVRRIVLVGYDMTTAQGSHWHGRHGGGLPNPTEANVGRWRRAVDGAADAARDLDVEVLNASSGSALRRYRKVSLAEALEKETQ